LFEVLLMERMESYEIAVKQVIPAARLSIIRSLSSKYMLNETQISRIMGISQAAVSKYLSGKYSNGVVHMEKKVDQALVEECARAVAGMGRKGEGTVNMYICRICKNVNDFGCKFSRA
jgi:predicted transcriptional regulator